jgi:hypothetical protein
MFKALRDRDLWGSNPHDGAELWYENWRWYRAWSETEKYLGPFPLDAWHNLDVMALSAAFVAGRGHLDWCVIAFLAIALPSKFLFYHLLLMRHPVRELTEQWREMAELNQWVAEFFRRLFGKSQ